MRKTIGGILAVSLAICLAIAWGAVEPGAVESGAVESGAVESGPVIRTAYHLTARAWRPLNISRDRYLDVLEGLCRFSVRHQDASGAIIDPFLHREHQYATPYFAYAVGTLVSAGRSLDLLPNGVRAMEHSTSNFAGGRAAIPDEHGEFFIAALTEALALYGPRIPAAQLAEWRQRLRRPLQEVVRGGVNNWETYAMKGEWLRAQAGLSDRADVIAVIEQAWRLRQRGRFAASPWSLYHDRSSDPDTLSVEAVGRGNLLALIESGYDGPSAEEMRRLAEAGTRTTLDLQDPSGQVPANGRTADHVWVDVGYQLGFEVMAERTRQAGDSWLAGQYRHAAMASFQSIQRWRRSDGDWAGSFFVTKNRFDPALRVGYQQASEYSNYNGSLMFHLAEAYHARQHEIAEEPSPAEIGGYAISTDAEFSSAFANAGGMQVQANLRGQAEASSGNRWTPLGIVRFARAGWDTRLGPSDGALGATRGISFAPEFEENGRWLRMADLSTRYEGVWSVEFVHPLLVRCAVEYRPKHGQQGPTFRDALIVTPDGVHSTMRKTSRDAVEWGVTWPLLANDGKPLELTTDLSTDLATGLATGSATGHCIRTVRFPAGNDQQSFIADQGSEFTEGGVVRGSYGDLLPVRVRASGAVQHTLVYPRSPGDPPSEAVRDSLVVTGDGFRSVLGRVSGTIYVGRAAAGGFGSGIDLDGDGVDDVTFDRPCGFVLQLRGARVIAVETDRAVHGKIQGRSVPIPRYSPVPLQ